MVKYEAKHTYESKIIPGALFSTSNQACIFDLETAMALLSTTPVPKRGSREHKALVFLLDYMQDRSISFSEGVEEL